MRWQRVGTRRGGRRSTHAGALGGILLLTLTLGAFLGCQGAGDGSTEDTASGAPIELDDLCGVFVEDLCRHWLECGTGAFRDEAHCQSQIHCSGVAELQGAVADGRIDYDASAAGTCHAKLADDPCEFVTPIIANNVFDVLTECGGVLTPHVPVGSACVHDRECLSQACEKAGDVCPGTCRALSGEGGACSGNLDCDDGLWCDSVGVCRAPLVAGDPCDEGSCWFSLRMLDYDISYVRPILYCDVPTNTCKAGAALGETCGELTDGTNTWDVTCGEGWCEAIGEGAVGTCKPLNGLRGNCVGFSGCEEGLQCEGTDVSNAVFGSCVPFTEEEQPCIESATWCTDGLYCLDDICQRPRGDGASCSQDEHCQSGFCEGVCVEDLRLGAPCDESADRCRQSRCIAGTCERYQRVGEPCDFSSECYRSVCVGGICVDDSICAAE